MTAGRTLRTVSLVSRTLLVFYLFLSGAVNAADEAAAGSSRRGYKTGDAVAVSCLNRTIETGEHILDSHGNLQYIPFPLCKETSNTGLFFPFNTPMTINCTIENFTDELYHLFEYFVHSDVPLSCRVPSYPLSPSDVFTSTGLDTGNSGEAEETVGKWTMFTIALQGTLQLSHLHIHTTINTIFHTVPDYDYQSDSKQKRKKNNPAGRKSKKSTSHLIGSTAYSLPSAPGSDQASRALNLEGTKIIRNEPLTFTFNVGWIDGPVLPGMEGRPVPKVTDHSVGFSLLSFFALASAAGTGALAMLIWERRKSGRATGLLPVSSNGGVAITRGYGGYGGYSSSNAGMGKRD